MSDTFSGSDFSAAASASSSEAASSPASAETTAPVTTETPEPAATVQADATEETPTDTTAPVVEHQGPIPFKVHHTALENARAKAREEAIADYKSKVGWAESVDRAHFEEMSRMGQLYQQDRGAFVKQLLTEAVSDPALAPMVRSEAARLLGARAPQEETVPDIPILGSNNEVVGNLGDIVSRILEKELAPLKQDREQRQAEAEKAKAAAERTAAINQRADADVAYVTSRPWFKEHRAEILRVFQEQPTMSLVQAADHYLDTVVLPNLSKTERAKVFKGLGEKTAATTVSPSSGTTSLPTPDSDKDWTELFAEKAAGLGIT